MQVGEIEMKLDMERLISTVLESHNKMVINALNGVIEFIDEGKPELAKVFTLRVIKILSEGDEEE